MHPKLSSAVAFLLLSSQTLAFDIRPRQEATVTTVTIITAPVNATSSLLSACSSKYSSLVSASPTVPPAVSNYLITSLASAQATVDPVTFYENANFTQLCESQSQDVLTQTFSDSALATAWTSYWFEAYSFEQNPSVRSAASDIISSCSGVRRYSILAKRMIATDASECATALDEQWRNMLRITATTTSAQETGTSTSSSAEVEETGNGDNNDGGEAEVSTTSSTAGAWRARETGYVNAIAALGAAAAVGVVGGVVGL
ncbi:hypothetical protein QBC38DRAFT_492695 [Podospora fimiseda]|uniref:Infection structure specific protein n=1 Tax=Podospora fimiseda TaxID=252190 RepID=A0AAN7BGG1_9PEZI|nr:hypothetical protein QBC38DRAFT_492695 [Podospora fimiseda]